MVATLDARFRHHTTKHFPRMTDVERGPMLQPSPTVDDEVIDPVQLAAQVNLILTRLIAIRLDTNREMPLYPTPIMKQIDMLARARSELRFGHIEQAKRLFDQACGILDRDEPIDSAPTPIICARVEQAGS